MTKHKPGYHRVLFIPDIHVPFHDMVAIKAMLAFVKDWKPQVVFFLGDVVDFYAISHFAKDPLRSLQLQEEIDDTNKILDLICKSTPDSKRFFIRGNHEQRMQKYLWTKAAELSRLNGLKVENLLKLSERDISYLSNGRHLYRGTVIKHGDIVRKFGAYTARGEFESTGMSGVSGHTHRLAVYPHSNEAGDFMWMECGCLCRLDPEYMDGKKPNWQQGFGIGYYKDGSARFHMERVPIIKGKAMHGGYEYY